MVTVIALLLGLAVVALPLSSTQFSPRLLRNFLRDRPNQAVLSVFVGTFAYAAGGLFDVGVSAGERVDAFPRLAVTVAVALLFLSLALLVYFADHLAHSIQVDHIMRVVERTTLPVIRDLPAAGTLPAVPERAITIPAQASGYVQVVHVEQLLATAVTQQVNVRLRVRVGEHVVAGSILAWVWPASPEATAPAADSLVKRLDAAVRIGFERTLEQDPALGLRQLVDPACKALSPAVNDPYTAVQAVEHLTVLIAALAARPRGHSSSMIRRAWSPWRSRPATARDPRQGLRPRSVATACRAGSVHTAADELAHHINEADTLLALGSRFNSSWYEPAPPHGSRWASPRPGRSPGPAGAVSSRWSGCGPAS